MGANRWRAPRWVCAALPLLLTACAAGRSAAPTTIAGPDLVIVTATVGPPPLSTSTPSAARTYVVREGDTLSAIAERFDVAEDAVMRANGLSDPNRLFVGQELVIPPPEP